MCFRFGSCFNGGKTEDDYGRRPKADRSDDYHGRRPKAVSSDVYHGYAQDRAYGDYVYRAADEASKLAARNNKVGDDHAGYMARVHEAADRENAMDYHTTSHSICSN